MLAGSTLVVVADGALARFLSRARPGLPLVELVDHRMDVGAAEPERGRPARTNDRYGAGRHKIEQRLTAHEATEEAFLDDVAQRVSLLVGKLPDCQLMLCAPPKALGHLRRALPGDAQKHLRLSLDKDLTKEIPSEIDARLRRLHV